MTLNLPIHRVLDSCVENWTKPGIPVDPSEHEGGDNDGSICDGLPDYPKPSTAPATVTSNLLSATVIITLLGFWYN